MSLSPGAGGGTLIPPSASDNLTAPLQLPAVPGKPLTTEGGNVLDDGSGAFQVQANTGYEFQVGNAFTGVPYIGVDGADSTAVAMRSRNIGGGGATAKFYNGVSGLVVTSISEVGLITTKDGISTTPPAVATPGVPASGTAVTNTTGVDVMVYVTGGTVTEIAVGATATGIVGGGVYLAAGQTITLTYSAAPSWTWLAV